MTTRTILLTLAASVAPLYAQQPATPVPAAQVFSALATPSTPTTAASPEQRAQVFSALALLPQNISDFAVLTQVGDNLLRLAQSGKLPELDAGDLPAELLALDNIALATTPASPATYALLQHILVSLSTVDSTLELTESWASEARSELSDTIIEELVLQADARAALPEGMAEGTHLPASYIILTSKPGEETVLQECAELLQAELREGDRPGVSPVEGANGFSGIRINVVETYAAELDDMTQDMAPRRKAQLMEALAQHPLCILARQQGNSLVIALCENPQELALADAPANSLLATPALAPCDANLTRGMIAAAVISPELAALSNAVNSQPTCSLAAGMSAVFNKLAAVEPANRATYEKAASAIGFMSEQLQKLTRPITRPSFMQMWHDGDLHLAATADAQGCSYRPGQLRLATMADAPQTSLYAESTPVSLGLTPPDSGELIEAAFNVAEGFSLTLAGKDREEAAAALTMAKAFTPELRALAAAGRTMGEGLNGQLAFVMDSTPGHLPQFSAITPAHTTAEVPRLSIYAGVSDRSKLAQGWDALLVTAGQVAGKFGLPPEVVGMLPLASQQVGPVTNYSLALPFVTQETTPSLAVSDSSLVFGTSAALNLRVAESATGTTPFAGAVFALKFAPLAATLRSLATALDHHAEEAQPAAASKVRLEEENGAPVAVIGGADGPASVFLSRRSANADDAAEQLSTAAAIMEYASSVSEGLYGTTTIENGLHQLHIQLKMKD